MNSYGSMMPGSGMDGVQKSLIPTAQRRKRRVLFSQSQVYNINISLLLCYFKLVFKESIFLEILDP